MENKTDTLIEEIHQLSQWVLVSNGDYVDVIVKLLLENTVRIVSRYDCNDLSVELSDFVINHLDMRKHSRWSIKDVTLLFKTIQRKIMIDQVLGDI